MPPPAASAHEVDVVFATLTEYDCTSMKAEMNVRESERQGCDDVKSLHPHSEVNRKLAHFKRDRVLKERMR